jgi:hypothetical protein
VNASEVIFPKFSLFILDKSKLTRTGDWNIDVVKSSAY